MTSVSTQYVIIGSGVAGSTIAHQILNKGLGSVIMLEAGSPVIMRDRRKWLDYVTSISEQNNPWGRQLTRYHDPHAAYYDDRNDYQSIGPDNIETKWDIHGGRMFARGGSTIAWGGWCPRLKPEDFELRSRTGKGTDWPFSYADIEPYYVQAEHYLGVAGDSSIGRDNPPRSARYPFEAPPFTQSDGAVIHAMEKLDMSYGHIPVARNAISHNERPACQTFGTCKYCPIGARFTGDIPLNQLEAAYPKMFQLRVKAHVTNVLMNTAQQAQGVSYIDGQTGVRHEIHADRVILCAGAIETPKILLNSTYTDWWPNGIGNTYDHVGRYLSAHPFFEVNLHSKTNPYKYKNELMFPTLGSRHFDSPEYQEKGEKMAIAAYYLKPNYEIGDLVFKGYSKENITNTAYSEHSFRLLGYLEGMGHQENRVLIGQGTTSVGLPKTVIEAKRPLFDTNKKNMFMSRIERIGEVMGYTASNRMYPQRGDHASGTCRMSSSPDQGVVDANLKVHGTDNLWVCSNAVMPSNGTANPTLTLVAMALRFVDSLN